MTVKQLRQQLKQMPDDMQVICMEYKKYDDDIPAIPIDGVETTNIEMADEDVVEVVCLYSDVTIDRSLFSDVQPNSDTPPQLNKHEVSGRSEQCDHPYASVIGEERGAPKCLKCGMRL